MSIAEQLKGKKYGEIVTELKGVTFKAIYDHKTGEGEYGPWSLQNAIITDGETDMRCLFVGLPNAKELEGESVNLLSTETKSFGFQGIKLTKNEYEGETRPEIRITKAGYIDLNGKRALYEKKKV